MGDRKQPRLDRRTHSEHSLKSSSFSHDAKADDESSCPQDCLRLKIMSWNIAVITFPFVAPKKRVVFAYLFLWGSWHDRFYDVSLLPLEEASIGRIAQQASYIKASTADVVMLQEVPGVSYTDALMKFLGDDFDVRYARRKPTALAIIIWIGLTVIIPSLQMLFLEPILRAILQPWVLTWTGGTIGRWLLLAAARSYTCRHSIVTQFLLGSVAGQLLVLRRRSSLVVGTKVAGDASFEVVDFKMFEGEGASQTSKGFLAAFFSARPRGVLQVSMPIVDMHGGRSKLHVLNTHLPHASENDSLLDTLGRDLAKISSGHATVVLGGDFNPVPDRSLASQLEPLIEHGCLPTNDLAKGVDAGFRFGTNDELITWDLKQPLTRTAEETPRSMQLDFLFVNQTSKPGTDLPSRCKLEVVGTEIVHPRNFNVAGAPLSDHYGIATTFRVDVSKDSK